MQNFKIQIIDFLKKSHFILEALEPLKNHAVIGLKVDNQFYFQIKKSNKGIEVFEDPSMEVDICFMLNFEATRHLIAQTKLNKTDFAIEMLKQAGMGNIDLSVHRSVLKLMRLGFIQSVTKLGAPFWSHLSHYGISNLSKLNQFLSRLKNG